MTSRYIDWAIPSPILCIASCYLDPEVCSNALKLIIMGCKIHTSAYKEVGGNYQCYDVYTNHHCVKRRDGR